MYTLGTAGHVDHGKSTLVHALTGIDPDRLEEEKRRAMTIDLGFAWLTLPSGREISLVDVPGHERFIKHMLAGVGGFDAVLLVIAADEGIRPQTREHLHIINLLAISHGIVALTKCDLVDDEWLELMEQEVRAGLAETTLAHAPLVRVSARSGAGLDELRAAIDMLLDTTPSRQARSGAPRLPIDRVFTVSGFGTVVTGTLADGPLHVGGAVEIQPQGLVGRIRGLQSHQQAVETALPGARVAVNISLSDRGALRRGAVLSLPGALAPSLLLDATLTLVADAPLLEHNSAAELFIGTASVPCHVALLDNERLDPGAQGLVQLRLAEPVAARRGDRFVLRRPSPPLTLGGGVVIDPHPPRHRRFRPAVIETLEVMAAGRPADLLAQALASKPPLEWRALLAALDMPAETAQAAFAESRATGQLLLVDPEAAQLNPTTIITSLERWQALCAELALLLESYQRRWPLRSGIPREELRARLGLSGKALQAVLARATAEGLLLADATSVWLPSHVPTPTPAQQALVAAILEQWRAAPTQPPGPEALLPLDPELRSWVFAQTLLVRVGPELLFLPETVEAMVAWVKGHVDAGNPLTLAQFRDHWRTTRKYAQALLEHTDDLGITRRVGDERIAAKR